MAISCLLNSVWDFFKDTASDCHLPETNSSQLYDLKLQILKNEKVITETLRGNITALEAKVTHTRETTMEECQKVAHNSMQTNKTQMLALREMQEKQLKYIAEQGTCTPYISYHVLLWQRKVKIRKISILVLYSKLIMVWFEHILLQRWYIQKNRAQVLQT